MPWPSPHMAAPLDSDAFLVKDYARMRKSFWFLARRSPPSWGAGGKLMPSKNRRLLRLIRRRSREPHGANAISPASRSFVQASELGAADIAIEGTAALSRLAAAARTEQCPPRRL